VIELPISRPSNRYLVRQRDRRWLHVLGGTLLLASALVAVLFAVGWPRLKATSIHYRLIRLRAEVDHLQQVERGLALQVERERDPARLARRAKALGLVPPSPGDAEVLASRPPEPPE
jgi:hypothetical protein